MRRGSKGRGNPIAGASSTSPETRERRLDGFAKSTLDRLTAGALLMLLSPLIVLLSLAIVLESPGSPFYRCRRIGRGGRPFAMIKFRKMHVGAAGPALTSPDDDRFTRLGRFLARTKLDELPQLWNVVLGDMSLVGPRPEDPSFVAVAAEEYEHILRVTPGITGLSQLAFAREPEILDDEDRVETYIQRLLPQKVGIDRLYAERRTFGMDLRILFWTVAAVAFRREVAVHRQTGRLNRRLRPPVEQHSLEQIPVSSS